MGIYDRDYLRDERAARGPMQRAGGIAGWRMWSVTTWLIVICVAVFVIDGFLPARFVLLERRETDRWPEVEGVDPSLLQQGPMIQTPQGEYLRPLLVPDAENRQVVVAYDVYMQMPFLQSYLHFSTQRGFLKLEFWRFLGFQFLHSHDTLLHLVFNMVALYFFGPIVERYLGSKRYLAFYLLCGIFGAVRLF